MEPTTAEHNLRQFRQAAYQALGHRKDTVFELLEAALVSPGPANLVHLSLAAPCRRRWSSACDALADDQVSPARRRAPLHADLPDPPAAARGPSTATSSSRGTRPPTRGRARAIRSPEGGHNG